MALGLPRAEMLARMSSAELAEWQTFEYVEPFGSKAMFLGHAMTSAAVMNSRRTKNSDPISKASDHMPKFEIKRNQSVEQMLQIAQAFTLGLGGKDKRGDKDG